MASYGSTGNIVADLSKLSLDNGITPIGIFATGECQRFAGKQYTIRNDKLPYAFARLPSLVFDGDGFKNNSETKKAIVILEQEKPDIVHIHNVHGSFLNIEAILAYCKKKGIKIIWTLHDPWLISGRCGYFFDCDKWKNGCHGCKNKDFYPRVIFGNESMYYKKRRALLNEHKDIVFVSPSNWLKELMTLEYQNNNVQVINNGIETSIFKRNEGIAEILEAKKGRFVIGFAAINLREEKGYGDMLRLANMCIGEDILFAIIGGEKTSFLSDNVLLVKKANNQKEMVDFYSSLDIFGDVTKMDNYPTTHLESLCCGTPVISYNSGGSCEMIVDGQNGIVVEDKNIEQFKEKLLKEMKERSLKPEIDVQKYDRKNCFSKYLELYSSLLSD